MRGLICILIAGVWAVGIIGLVNTTPYVAPPPGPFHNSARIILWPFYMAYREVPLWIIARMEEEQ